MAKVRFAPSPTGKLHLGSARTAVFNYLYARHTGGSFVLRIEDTDLNRSEEGYIESIIEDMKWMGMKHDEFYRQSDRFAIYREYVERLISEKKAYYCTCTKQDLIERNKARGITDETTKYDGHCRGNYTPPEGKHVIRLDTGEERDLIFKDAVRKRIRVNTKELDDYVLWKSDNSPTYNFAVVIDDALMEITHIIRGEDHITNTAKQIILYDYLGFDQPEWAHIPLVFGKDRSPLSKRKGSTNIEDYRAKGILPDALVNYIARLGWSHGNDEIFTMEELIRYFDIDKLNKSNAVYDEDKMVWVNTQHLKSISPAALSEQFKAFCGQYHLPLIGKTEDDAWLVLALDSLRERNATLVDLYAALKIYTDPNYSRDPDAIQMLKKLEAEPAQAEAYREAAKRLQSINGAIPDGFEDELRLIAESRSVKFGKLVQMLRIRLTGHKVSPDIITVIRLLGSDAADRL